MDDQTHTEATPRGAALLHQWLSDRGAGSATALAFRVGISSATISAWRHGIRTPSYRHRIAIARATAQAVPASSWAVTP